MSESGWRLKEGDKAIRTGESEQEEFEEEFEGMAMGAFVLVFVFAFERAKRSFKELFRLRRSWFAMR